MRLLTLVLPLALGCAHVTVEAERTEIWALGQVSVATGCPSRATDTDQEFEGLRAESGYRGPKGQQCVSVLGGPLSSIWGSIVSSLVGMITGLAAAGAF